MIERQIVAQHIREQEVKEFVLHFLGKLSCSTIELQRTPLGERIIVYTSKPGLVVGRKGANIKLLTKLLKTKYEMENPQLEVSEIVQPLLDAATIAKGLVGSFEKFGPKRFKAMAYKALESIMRAGALGAEIVISGRGIPGVRAKTWRFSAGYLKKSGDISENFIDKHFESCDLKSGTIGIKVYVLHPDVVLPDTVRLRVVKELLSIEEEILEDKKDADVATVKKVRKKKVVKKKEEISEKEEDVSVDEKELSSPVAENIEENNG